MFSMGSAKAEAIADEIQEESSHFLVEVVKEEWS
jgi:hypothetical protein